MECVNKRTELKPYPMALYSMLLVLSVLTLEATAALQYTLREQEPGDTYVGNIKRDSTLSERYDNATLDTLTTTFRFNRDEYQLFNIDERTGVLKTSAPIDRESVCGMDDPCLIKLDITIRPTRYFEIIQVTIVILDINDHTPEFASEKVIRAISETILPGVKFSIPSAEDLDSGSNGIDYYELTPLGNTDPSKFQLETSSNADGTKDINLVLLESLNREEEEEYSFRITAYDGGSPPKSGSILIDITVTDANDNNPVFDQLTYEVEIPENTPIGTTIERVQATDADSGDYGRIGYGFSTHTQGDFGHLFNIINGTGEIVVAGELDFEASQVYHLTVTATDLGPNALPAYSKVIVRLTDVNDQAPEISVNSLTVSGFAEVSENAPINTFVAHVSVSDADDGIAGEVDCELSGTDSSFFALQSLGSEYKVVTNDVFDSEVRWEYEATIVCHDRGTPSLRAIHTFPIHILDKNDHAPVFQRFVYYANFSENNNKNSYVTKIIATDRDEGNNSLITYSIRPKDPDGLDWLKINPNTGEVKAGIEFDYEDGHEYEYIITARDGGEPPLSATTTLRVNILDLNDESPVFSEEPYTFSIAENQPIGSVVGYVYAQDADPAPHNHVSFYIDRTLTKLDHFDVITEDDGKGKIVTSRILDRETKASYNVFLVAHNEEYFNTESTVVVTIDIIDENDNDPAMIFPSSREKSRVEISNKLPPGDMIVQINVTDSDIGTNGLLTYAISSGNEEGFMEIDNQTGVIIAIRSLKDIKHRVFSLEITVKDMGIPQRLAVADLDIIVDRGAVYGASNGMVSNTVLMIILGVIGSVLSLFILVIIIICCVCFKQKRNDKAHKYNCRLEANKTLISSPASKRLASPEHSSSSRQTSFQITEQHKNNAESPVPDYRSADDLDLVPQGNIYSTTYKENGVRHQAPPQQNSTMSGRGPDCSKMPDVVNLSHTEVDSECSGADSGKGTSEEGDMPWHGHQSNNSSPNSDIITSPSQQSKQPLHNATIPVTSSGAHMGTESFAKQLYDLDPDGSDLGIYHGQELYFPPQMNRNYSPLSSFRSKSTNPHLASNSLNRNSPIYNHIGNVDKQRYHPRTNLVDIQKYNQHSNSSNSPISMNYPVQYMPGKGDSALGVTFGSPRQHSASPSQNTSLSGYTSTSPRQKSGCLPPNNDNYVAMSSLSDATEDHISSLDSDTVPISTWSGREGSARGGDNRTHLFGSNNALNVPAHKSAFKAVGKNGTLKKNVRFADKNEELNISVDEEASSVDNLSDDGNSISSGTYVLDDGTYVMGDGSFVLEGSRSIGGDTFV